MWPGYLRGEFPPPSKDGAGPETNGRLAARKGQALDTPRLFLQLEIQRVNDVHIFTWMVAPVLSVTGSRPATILPSGTLDRGTVRVKE
jgi:hypothetical protein